MNKLIVDSISIAIQIGSVDFRAYLISILAWRKYFAWVDKDTIILEIDQTIIVINLSKAGICFQTKNLLKVRPQLLFIGKLLCS